MSRSTAYSSQRIPASRPYFSHARGERTRIIFVKPDPSKAKAALGSALARTIMRASFAFAP
jgi:hypothetical protein